MTSHLESFEYSANLGLYFIHILLGVRFGKRVFAREWLQAHLG